MEFLSFVENALIPKDDIRYSPWEIHCLPRTFHEVDMDEGYSYNQYLRAMVGDKKERSERAEEAEEKLKEGLRKIFKATKDLSKEVIEGFKEGYGPGKKNK